MSEIKEGNDRKLGRYLLNSSDCGGIDAEELANACRRLGISGPLEPLLRELKVKTENSVSPAKDSPARKASQKKEKRLSSKTRDLPDYCQDNFNIQLQANEKCNSNNGGKNSYGQESWGRDSGARDLSPEPNRIREALTVESQLMDAEAGGTSAMLHLASKLQVAALSALETEVLELSARLQNSERERDSIQKKLNDALEEKERSQRRLESIGAAHESRITEMHCVIVELSKKLKHQQENAILEEIEPDGSVSELSFQEGSVYNSEMECTNFEQQSQTEPLDIKLPQPDQKSESHYSLPPLTLNAGGQVQIQAMQEEILYLRSHMALLQSKLASCQDNIDHDAANEKFDNFENVRASPKARSNYTSDDLCETAEIFDASHTEEPAMMKAQKMNRTLMQQAKGALAQPLLYDSLPSLNGNHIAPQRVTSNDKLVPENAECCGRNRRRIDKRHTTNEIEHMVSELEADVAAESEIERLQRCIDHLRIQNNVLSISLAESKAHCEHLYLLCGKYESNAIALNQALNCSDRTIEAYDVMLALLESKLGILENTESAMDSRKAAESVAKHLMTRLESDTNTQGNSLGPWQNIMYDAGSNSHAQPWTDADDQKLREQMSKLKGQRAIIQNTVVILESPYNGCADSIETGGSNVNTKATECIQRRMDLETAVLMQELMSMREEFNEMKCRAEQSEREKSTAHERLAVMQQALLHLQAQLADSEALLAMSNKDRTSYSEAEHSAGIEMELVEALARESRLKARLQALASSLETATKSSEEKYAQVQCTVAELKQANLSLTQSLDRCKRKYQARVKRMEQQLIELSLKQGLENPAAKQLVPETTL